MDRKEVLKHLEEIENKFNNLEDKIQVLVDNIQQQKQFMEEFDFYKALGLTVKDVNLLLDYSNIDILKEEDIKRIIVLNNKLNQQYKWIDKINEAIIYKHGTNWKIVGRNQIQYLLNKNKNKNEKQNVIVNIHLENKKDAITLNKLKEGK